MKNKWVKIILVASLAFNLAFVSTALYKKFSAPGKEVKEALKTGLKLQKDQEEEIKKIIGKFKINLLEHKQDILDKRIAIIEAMNDPEFNTGDIEKKTGELNELENQLNMIFVEALVQINNILNGRQRSDFLLRLSQNWFFMQEGGHRD